VTTNPTTQNTAGQDLKEAANDFMAEIERRSDLPAAYIISPLIVSAVLVYFGFLEIHITSLVSIVFPVFWTVKALEHKEQDDDKQWYSYWVIWGYFFLLDIIMPGLLKMIPFFYFSKFLFFTWLFLPSTRGALYLYNNVFTKIPYDFSRITNVLEGYRMRINTFVERKFGINLDHYFFKNIDKGDLNTQEKKTDQNRNLFKEGTEMKDLSTPTTSHQTDTSHNIYSRTKDLHVQPPPREENDFQHESRQNIVGDAKINTENLKTNLQNVREVFNQTVDRMKEVRENIGSNTRNPDMESKKVL